MNTYFDREAVKICAVCNKPFWVPATSMWAYKESAYKDGVHTMLYFCKYSHKRAYEREQEENGAKEQELRERARRASRKGKTAESGEWEGKLCEECRYCSKGKYGFHDCTVYSYPVNPFRAACKKYKEKFEGQL